MAATAAQVAELRLMIHEPDETTYTDVALAGYIEKYPLIDERGEYPYTWDTSTTPPSQDENEDWIPTYDMHAAAGDIWEQKAAAIFDHYDFQADGGRYSRDQAYKNAMRLARHHRARRKPRTMKPRMYPDPDQSETPAWIGNLPEVD